MELFTSSTRQTKRTLLQPTTTCPSQTTAVQLLSRENRPAKMHLYEQREPIDLYSEAHVLRSLRSFSGSHSVRVKYSSVTLQPETLMRVWNTNQISLCFFKGFRRNDAYCGLLLSKAARRETCCLWHKRQPCAGMAGKSAEVGATASKAQLKLGRIRHFKRTRQYCSRCFSSVMKKRAEM